MQLRSRQIITIWHKSYGYLLLLFIVLPVIPVVVMSLSRAPYLSFPPEQISLRWYRAFFASPEWIQSTLLSLKIAFITTGLATLMGTLAGVGLTRSRFYGRRLVQGMLIMPVAFPVIIIALGLYFFLGQIGLLGTSIGLIIAHTVIAMPLVIINVVATLQGFDVELEAAAMTLGARPYRVFLRVTLPLISRGIVAGAIFAFLTSFDEIVMAIFLSGPETTTLPKRMWDGIRFEINPTMAAASTMLIAASTVLIFLIEATQKARVR